MLMWRRCNESYSHTQIDLILVITVGMVLVQVSGHQQMWGWLPVAPFTIAWISNHIHYEMWDEITNPFLNFNGATVEV